MKRKTPMARTGILRVASFNAEPKRRTRKCAVCRNPFEPRSMTHKVCCGDCGIIHAIRQREAKERKERQAGLEKLKRRADHLKETQAALNRWIREVRDAGKPCISCGRHHQGQNHAGHYLSRGSHPNLALVETNLALQCMPCNVHLSGNQLMFRRGLIERIGLAAVEDLESDNTPRKYSIDDLKAMKADYLNRIKDSKRKALKSAQCLAES